MEPWRGQAEAELCLTTEIKMARKNTLEAACGDAHCVNIAVAADTAANASSTSAVPDGCMAGLVCSNAWQCNVESCRPALRPHDQATMPSCQLPISIHATPLFTRLQLSS